MWCCCSCQVLRQAPSRCVPDDLSRPPCAQDTHTRLLQPSPLNGTALHLRGICGWGCQCLGCGQRQAGGAGLATDTPPGVPTTCLHKQQLDGTVLTAARLFCNCICTGQVHLCTMFERVSLRVFSACRWLGSSTTACWCVTAAGTPMSRSWPQ